MYLNSDTVDKTSETKKQGSELRSYSKEKKNNPVAAQSIGVSLHQRCLHWLVRARHTV